VPLTLPTSGALHFSSRGEYGVRLMVELARHHGDGPVSLSEMAAHEELPRPYLEQLVISLREAGLVVSTRGAHGGYQLAISPDAIRMSQVVEALEGPIAPMVCASHDADDAALCDRTDYCNVSRLWTRVRDAVLAALDSMTLAELAPPRPRHPFHALPVLAVNTPLAVSAPQPTPDTKEPMVDR
jgi:Rrf2 family transcriptional regulator, cysteine metabolism repressor